VKCGLDLRTGKKLTTVRGGTSSAADGIAEKAAAIPDKRLRRLVEAMLHYRPDLRARGPVHTQAELELRDLLAEEDGADAETVLLWGLEQGLGDSWALVRVLAVLASPKRIPLIMNLLQRKRISAAAALDYLTAVGGEDLFEPLLTAFRAAERTAIRPDGVMPYEDHLEDDARIAARLTALPEGVRRLKRTCSSQELERILFLAWKSGAAVKPELVQTLGELHTSVAMAGLVDIWLNARNNEIARLARDGLVRAGGNAFAHFHLFRLFNVERIKLFSESSSAMEAAWSAILELLGEIGDAACIPRIREVVDSNRWKNSLAQERIADDAARAVKAIKARCRQAGRRSLQAAGLERSAEADAAAETVLAEVLGDDVVDPTMAYLPGPRTLVACNGCGRSVEQDDVSEVEGRPVCSGCIAQRGHFHWEMKFRRGKRKK
jgi:hypothetical protein